MTKPIRLTEREASMVLSNWPTPCDDVARCVTFAEVAPMRALPLLYGATWSGFSVGDFSADSPWLRAAADRIAACITIQRKRGRGKR